MALLLLVLALLPCALSKATIETNKLFLNTIKRWDIDIVSRSDHAERYRRFVRAQRSVDETTSGVMLTSLNKHTVMNDKEFDATIGAVNRHFNMNNTMANEEKREFHQQRKKRDATWKDSEKWEKWEKLPESYMYWDETVGFAPAGNQHGCGSCWAFPNVATMEALYKERTGETVRFSEQYFVDCTYNSWSGCAGGNANTGFKLTVDRQYLRSAELTPYTTFYKGCTYADDIASFTNNALKKLWISDWYPLGKHEDAMLRGLMHSPVSFGTYISFNMFSYSGGLFDDPLCVADSLPHAMLLVGYTENSLRVRQSYGPDFGDKGYVNYKRGAPALLSCKFYDVAFILTVEYRRDMQYEFCNNKKVATRKVCKASCEAMNTDTESGWTLATIPTRYHSKLVTDMLKVEYPGVKNEDKFNYLWIGVENLERNWNITRADNIGLQYVSGWDERDGKYGLINKNTGLWSMRNSNRFQARGLCSRAINCWNIDAAVENGAVSFSDDSLKEGTAASVTCQEGYKLVGESRLACKGGKWDADLPFCVPEGEVDDNE